MSGHECLQIDDEQPITAFEVEVDTDGNLIQPDPKVIEIATEKARRQMAEIWHENTAATQELVSKHGLSPINDLYSMRTPWTKILSNLIPTWYRVLVQLKREYKARRLNATRDKILLCGTGDSFVESALHIQEAKEAGWDIMAVDRARPQLMTCGLVPDYTVTLDGQRHVCNWFEDLQPDETVMVSFQSHPSIYEKVIASEADLKVYSTAGLEGYNEFIYEKFGSDYLQTLAYLIVMPTAIDIAIRMGYKTIATIGTELGWHTKEDVEQIYRLSAYEMDDGWWTITMFEKAAQGFISIANLLSMSNEFHKEQKGFKPRNLLDCSGGIYKGYEYMPIDKLLENY